MVFGGEATTYFEEAADDGEDDDGEDGDDDAVEVRFVSEGFGWGRWRYFWEKRE